MTEQTGCPIPCRAVDPHERAILQEDNEWEAEIVSTYSRLFPPPIDQIDCGDGWRWLIEATCKKIEDVLRPEDGDTINLVKIVATDGILNIFWEGMLSARARVEVEQVVEWANMESAHTCEICGFRDARLYSFKDLLLTLCTGHRRGKALSWKSRSSPTRMVRGTVDGQDRVLSCRQYHPEHHDFFGAPFEPPEV